MHVFRSYTNFTQSCSDIGLYPGIKEVKICFTDFAGLRFGSFLCFRASEMDWGSGKTSSAVCDNFSLFVCGLFFLSDYFFSFNLHIT